MLVIYSLLIISLVVASIYDTATHRIPNWLSFSVMVSGLLWNTFFSEGLGLKDSVAGLGAGFALMLLGYIFGNMGAGDTKLMAAIGSVVGFGKVVDIVFCGYMVMFAMAIIFITVQGDLGKLLFRYKVCFYGWFGGVGMFAYQKPDSSEAAGRRMPLAPAIALATGYVLYPTFCQLTFMVTVCHLYI